MENAQTKFLCHRIFCRARGLPKHAYVFGNKVAEKWLSAVLFNFREFWKNKNRQTFWTCISKSTHPKVSFGKIKWNLIFWFCPAILDPYWHSLLSNCVFEDGKYSWRLRLLVPREPGDHSHQLLRIGVRHPYHSDSFWYWSDGYRFSSDISVPSSIGSCQRGDVFICFLDLDQRQLKIYNDRTKESDIWRNIEGPVNLYLLPDYLSWFPYVDVR